LKDGRAISHLSSINIPKSGLEDEKDQKRESLKDRLVSIVLPWNAVATEEIGRDARIFGQLLRL